MSNGMAEEDFPWKTLVDGSPDGILAFDREFRYTVWNRAMERIAGVPAERVLGRVAWEVFPFLKEQGENIYLEAALAGEVRESADHPFRVPESGREGYFRAEYAPLRNGEGENIGGMAVIRESTASWRAQAEHARLMGRVEFLHVPTHRKDDSTDAATRSPLTEPNHVPQAVPAPCSRRHRPRPRRLRAQPVRHRSLAGIDVEDRLCHTGADGWWLTAAALCCTGNHPA